MCRLEKPIYESERNSEARELSKKNNKSISEAKEDITRKIAAKAASQAQWFAVLQNNILFLFVVVVFYQINSLDGIYNYIFTVPLSAGLVAFFSKQREGLKK